MGKNSHRKAVKAVPQEAGVARFVMGLVLVAGTVTLFWPCTQNGLVYDDEPLILDSFVRSGLSAAGVWSAFTSIEAAHWHPLTWISFEIDQAIGFGPRGFHATNIFMHALNAWLLYQVLLRSTGAMWRSWFAAALFAIHPLHVESVAWVAERKDVLSTFFWLLALLTYVRYAHTPHRRTLQGVVLLMALGLMAKSMLVTLPITLLIFDWWPLGRMAGNNARQAITWHQAVREKTPLFVLASIGIGVQMWVQRISWRNEPVVPLSLRLENGIVAPVIYLRKLFWPNDLAAFYPFPSGMYASSEVVLAGVLLSGITILALKLARTRPYLLAGWAWYLITLAPVSGVFQVLGGQAYADRYTYVPLIGIFWIVAWGLEDAASMLRGIWSETGAKTVVVGGASLCLAILCWLTSRQIPTWHDDFQLWKQAVTVNPDNYFALNNLGVALERRERFEEAIQLYGRSVALKSNYSGSHSNLGQLFERHGQLADAEREYREAIKLDPDNVQVWKNLGRLLGTMGKWREAADAARRAGTITPNDPAVHWLFGMNLLYAGEFKDAKRELEVAKKMDPQMSQAWYCLGSVQMIEGEDSQALDSFSRAASLSPERGPYAYALAQALRKAGSIDKANELFDRARVMDAGWMKMANDLAWTMATSPDNSARNGRCALWLSSQICQVVDRQNVPCLETLAAAQAEVGDFAAATTSLHRLLTEPHAGLSADKRSSLESQLRGYERHQPYRQGSQP
jgi:Flp pilus assembly protein TadD